MEIENKKEWKICKNNLSEENPCGICLSGSSGKTVFHKCANGVNHVFHKACMKAWYDMRTSSRTCPTCKEKISIGVLKGRYQDLAEKFEKWNYPQADQVENLDKGTSIVITVVAGISLSVAIGTLLETAELLKQGPATGAMGMVTGTTLITAATAATLGATISGFKYSLTRRKEMTAAMAAAVATGALTAGALTAVAARAGARAAVATAGTVGAVAALTTGILRDGVVEQLTLVVGASALMGTGGAGAVIGVKAGAEAIAAGLVGVIAAALGAELTGRVTESFTHRIVRWMKK